MPKMYDKDSKSGLIVKKDSLPLLKTRLAILVRDEVLVGFPEETTDRPPEVEGKPSPVTNAQLGYIHDQGAPEARIPARPFMIEGITEAKEKVTKLLAKGAQGVLSATGGDASASFEAVGLVAVSAIQTRIRSNIPPPLADSTVRARARKGRKGAQAELNRREAGYGASLQLARPLQDTNELLKSVNYVVRNRNKRRK